MRRMLALMILFVMVPVAAAQASLVSIDTTADGYATTTTNWSSSIINIGGPDLFVNYLTTNDQARAALEFNISSIPSSSTIVSAYFDIYGISTDANIGLHGYSGDGIITSADFTITNLITTFNPVSGLPPALNHVDVTTFVSGLIGGGQNYAGFQLRELVLGEFNTFVSTQGAGISLDAYPELIVEYVPVPPVPEPSAILLLGSGLLGLWGVKRKFKK